MILYGVILDTVSVSLSGGQFDQEHITVPELYISTPLKMQGTCITRAHFHKLSGDGAQKVGNLPFVLPTTNDISRIDLYHPYSDIDTFLCTVHVLLGI